MRFFASALVVISSMSACLPSGDVCCKDDVDCNQGERCFEGKCAVRCDDDSQCNAGEECDASGEVCTAIDPSSSTLKRCPYHAPPRLP